MSNKVILEALNEIEVRKQRYYMDTEPNRMIVEGLEQAEEILLKLSSPK